MNKRSENLIFIACICGVLASGLMLAFFVLLPSMSDTVSVLSDMPRPGLAPIPVITDGRVDQPDPFPTPVPYQLLQKQYTSRNLDGWKSMKIEDYGISDIKLPPGFEDYYFSWTTIDTVILEFGEDPGGPGSDFLINITESVKNPGTSSKQGLEKAIGNHKNQSLATAHSDVRVHYINNVKGVLTQKIYNNGKIWLEWVTFRYFKGEKQRIRIEVNISDGKFRTLAPVLNSVKFTENPGEYLKWE